MSASAASHPQSRLSASQLPACMLFASPSPQTADWPDKFTRLLASTARLPACTTLADAPPNARTHAHPASVDCVLGLWAERGWVWCGELCPERGMRGGGEMRNAMEWSRRKGRGGIRVEKRGEVLSILRRGREVRSTLRRSIEVEVVRGILCAP